MCTIDFDNLDLTAEKLILKTAIESPNFPFEYLSIIAEIESWRKEVHRPIYYVHKWWARRLGTVFRAIIIGTFCSQDCSIVDDFYKQLNLKGSRIFDPFMGSGVTVGEAVKLGATAIGRDINPVAYFLVKNALSQKDKGRIQSTFEEIKQDIYSQMQKYYTTVLSNGEPVTVLYYFWVKYLPCPQCHQQVDLFSSYIFSKHAYPNKFPEAKAVCPNCGDINSIHYKDTSVTCQECGTVFNPQVASVKGKMASCKCCGHYFQINKTIQNIGKPPSHRMYAKLVLLKNGVKQYLTVKQYDIDLYKVTVKELSQRDNFYPVISIQPGNNTNQILNYSYHYWHEMFNERQLLCLGILAERIKKIEDVNIRDLFICLFSGVLEFNNIFCSFKGEGTGAVRPMFSNHILKPERTPIEANIWGTPKSSGSFSTLFASRIIKAIDYCEKPFELKAVKVNQKWQSEKVYGISNPISYEIANSFQELNNLCPVYLSVGDSGETDIPTESIDAVITDPPFFDNVHYSELADFFYVWQCYLITNHVSHKDTTRHPHEVQSSDSLIFAHRLQRVFGECHRVLKTDGLMIFTYHHSRTDGWSAILSALVKADFAIVATHPIKSEMSVATSKSQAKEPIDIDVIVVCRKREKVKLDNNLTNILEDAYVNAVNQVERFNSVQRRLSKNDILVVLMAQVLKGLSVYHQIDTALDWLEEHKKEVIHMVEGIYLKYKNV
ncbi:DNA adenine methylase [Nostoc sp.]